MPKVIFKKAGNIYTEKLIYNDKVVVHNGFFICKVSMPIPKVFKSIEEVLIVLGSKGSRADGHY